MEQKAQLGISPAEICICAKQEAIPNSKQLIFILALIHRSLFRESLLCPVCCGQFSPCKQQRQQSLAPVQNSAQLLGHRTEQ